MNIFNKIRISFDEMYKDTISFLQKEYEQASQVFTNASPFGQLLTVILNMGKLIFYYIEDSITELNIKTATRPNSIYGLAALSGHNPMRAITATGNVKITYNGENVDMYGNTIIIPNYTKIKCIENGYKYLLVTPSEEIRITLTPGNSIIVKIIQGEIEVQKATGNGLKLQSYSFTSTQGKQIDNFHIKVYVNSKQWKIYESIYDIPYQSEGCVVRTGMTSGIDVFFGNGYRGLIPEAGSEIRVEYLLTSGLDGNIRMTNNTTWEFEDEGYDIIGNEINIKEVFKITTESNISFGTNSEPLYLTKLLTPITSRNYVLANTTNYIYFFERFNYFSYIDVFTTFDDDNIEDDNVVYLFLIPDINKRKKTNENYFTVPQDNFLLKEDEKLNIYNLIEQSGQKIITTVCKIIKPKIKRYIINIAIGAFGEYSKDIIRQQIESKLSEYFLNNRRRDKIPKSDLIAIIENIQGVDTVNLWFTSEENEINKKLNPEAEDIGIDNFGDIIMDRDTLVLIRGGWEDRNNVYINDGINYEKPSSVNIQFVKDVSETYNSVFQQSILKKMKK